MEQFDRTRFLFLVAGAGVGNVQIEHGRNDVEKQDDRNRRFSRCIHGGIDQRKVKPEQRARHRRTQQYPANNGAGDDRADRQSLDPAIGHDQFFRRQQFGEDAIFGGRIRRRTETNHAIRDHHRNIRGQTHRGYIFVAQHQQAADHFDGVGDQHHAALRKCIRKRADEWCEYHVGHGEEKFQ